MNIVLTQTGGLMGRTKIAEAEWPDSAEDFDAFVAQIKQKKNKGANDNYLYFIKSTETDKSIPVSIQAIPEKYAPLFDELYQKLKIKPI